MTCFVQSALVVMFMTCFVQVVKAIPCHLTYRFNQLMDGSINQSTAPSLSLVSYFLQAGQLSFIKRPSYMYLPLTLICAASLLSAMSSVRKNLFLEAFFIFVCHDAAVP